MPSQKLGVLVDKHDGGWPYLCARREDNEFQGLREIVYSGHGALEEIDIDLDLFCWVGIHDVREKVNMGYCVNVGNSLLHSRLELGLGALQQIETRYDVQLVRFWPLRNFLGERPVGERCDFGEG